MGKGSRLKKERAAELAEQATNRSNQGPADLLIATEIVGLLFGVKPDCAGAAGVLYATGEELGYSLRALPVSVVAVEKATNTLVMMGPKASERFSEDAIKKMENHRPNGKDTGHIVLISDDHGLLLDPNMRQLGSYGIEAPSVALRLKSVVPESGEWVFDSEALVITYIPDEENHALIPHYETSRRESTPYAQMIASGIRSGMPVEVIVDQMKRPV